MREQLWLWFPSAEHGVIDIPSFLCSCVFKNIIWSFHLHLPRAAPTCSLTSPPPPPLPPRTPKRSFLSSLSNKFSTTHPGTSTLWLVPPGYLQCQCQCSTLPGYHGEDAKVLCFVPSGATLHSSSPSGGDGGLLITYWTPRKDQIIVMMEQFLPQEKHKRPSIPWLTQNERIKESKFEYKRAKNWKLIVNLFSVASSYPPWHVSPSNIYRLSNVLQIPKEGTKRTGTTHSFVRQLKKALDLVRKNRQRNGSSINWNTSDSPTYPKILSYCHS